MLHCCTVIEAITFRKPHCSFAKSLPEEEGPGYLSWYSDFSGYSLDIQDNIALFLEVTTDFYHCECV
jgi:hypothetical protein